MVNTGLNNASLVRILSIWFFCTFDTLYYCLVCSDFVDTDLSHNCASRPATCIRVFPQFYGALLVNRIETDACVLVLGRIHGIESGGFDFLEIFAGEREESIQMSRNRFRIATIPKPKREKTHYLKPTFWYQNDQKKYFKPHFKPPTTFL
jgi:hypothetical protein